MQMVSIAKSEMGDHVVDLGVDGSMILKLLTEAGCDHVDRINSVQVLVQLPALCLPLHSKQIISSLTERMLASQGP
jgi:hypothetical protein